MSIVECTSHVAGREFAGWIYFDWLTRQYSYTGPRSSGSDRHVRLRDLESNPFFSSREGLYHLHRIDRSGWSSSDTPEGEGYYPDGGEFPDWFLEDQWQHSNSDLYWMYSNYLLSAPPSNSLLVAPPGNSVGGMHNIRDNIRSFSGGLNGAICGCNQ